MSIILIHLTDPDWTQDAIRTACRRIASHPVPPPLLRPARSPMIVLGRWVTPAENTAPTPLEWLIYFEGRGIAQQYGVLLEWVTMTGDLLPVALKETAAEIDASQIYATCGVFSEDQLRELCHFLAADYFARYGIELAVM